MEKTRNALHGSYDMLLDLIHRVLRLTLRSVEIGTQRVPKVVGSHVN